MSLEFLLNQAVAKGASTRHKMQTFDKHLETIYEQGYISKAEALEHAKDTEYLKSIISNKVFS